MTACPEMSWMTQASLCHMTSTLAATLSCAPCVPHTLGPMPPCPHQHQQSETGHSQCRWPSPSMLCTPRPISLSVLANKTIPSQLVINCHSSQHLSQIQPHCQL